MAERPLRILQVNTMDNEGGAAKIARSLFLAYRRRGHASWLAVRDKRSSDPDVFVIPREANGPGKGSGRLGRSLRLMTHPRTLANTWRGIEDFDFPGTYRLLDLPPKAPTLVHCHNLHQGYFDLRALPWLSRQVPVVLTLHDAWLLSGHCAHSLECERWMIGCGSCPYLSVEPPVWRDATAINWQRKQKIFAGSRVYVATPCRWLMQKVEQSMLAVGAMESRVIPNGVDLSVFRPADRKGARAKLGIQQGINVILFVANNMRRNCWKDWNTLRAAAAIAAGTLDRELLVIGLGEGGTAERTDGVEFRFIPYREDPEEIARYYQAADLYVHAARADTFPNTVLEALACGTPVVATAVGGIPEQVNGLQDANAPFGLNTHGPGDATGILVPPGDAEAMGRAISALLDNEPLRRRLGENSVRDAGNRFNLDRQVEAYLDWYKSMSAPGAP
jgi:glycosyltransferase involved in cell wall biosynthesis